MPKARYPRCYKFPSRSGTVRWYVRRGNGPKIRVHGVYGTPEFEANYLAVMSGVLNEKPKVKAGKQGTLRWLVDMWKQSSDWAQTSPATQKQRENILLHVLKTAGDADYAAYTEADIRAGRERRKDTPAAANNFLKTMKALYRWAKESDLIAADPAKDVKKLRLKTGGFPPWTLEEVEKFRARWPLGTRERLALEILLNTGLRRGDAVRLGRQHVKDGVASFRAEKTNVTLYIPITPTLKAAIDAGPTGDLTYIATEKGLPMVKEGFGNWFRKACNAAGISKSAHGLRKLAATVLGDTSGSELELQALFGWVTNDQSLVYTREANKRRLALQAAMKLQAGLEQK